MIFCLKTLLFWIKILYRITSNYNIKITHLIKIWKLSCYLLNYDSNTNPMGFYQYAISIQFSFIEKIDVCAIKFWIGDLYKSKRNPIISRESHFPSLLILLRDVKKKKQMERIFYVVFECFKSKSGLENNKIANPLRFF